MARVLYEIEGLVALGEGVPAYMGLFEGVLDEHGRALMAEPLSTDYRRQSTGGVSFEYEAVELNGERVQLMTNTDELTIPITTHITLVGVGLFAAEKDGKASIVYLTSPVMTVQSHSILNFAPRFLCLWEAWPEDEQGHRF